MIKSFYLFFSVFILFSKPAFSKCRSKDRIVRETSIFVKGYVRNLKKKPKSRKETIEGIPPLYYETREYTRNGFVVSFNVEIAKVLKGKFKEKNISVEYFEYRAFPGFRQFSEDNLYIFPVYIDSKGKAHVGFRTCSSRISEEDIKNPKKLDQKNETKKSCKKHTGE